MPLRKESVGGVEVPQGLTRTFKVKKASALIGKAGRAGGSAARKTQLPRTKEPAGMPDGWALSTGTYLSRYWIPSFEINICLRPALQHLSSDACGINDLVTAHGQPAFYAEKTKDGSSLSNFQSLAKAIVFQQLAGAAASTIWSRLLALAAHGQVCLCLQYA
jgi:hypothetical protein